MASQSFSTACTDLIDSVTRLSTQIGAFVRGVRSARRDLDAVSHELSSLSLCLQSLRDESDEIRYPAGFQGTLSNVIGECNLVIGEMATLLISSKSGGRAQWIPTTSDEMARLRNSLKSQRSAIEIALEFLSCIWDAEAITDNPAHNDKASTEEDRRGPSPSNVSEKSQMAALEERVGFLQVQLSRMTDNDDGYMIQRLREVTGFHPESINERRPLTPLFATDSIELELESDNRRPFNPGAAEPSSSKITTLRNDDDPISDSGDSGLWPEDYSPVREPSPPPIADRQSAGDAYIDSPVPSNNPVDPVEAITPELHNHKDIQPQERQSPLPESLMLQNTLEKTHTPQLQRTPPLPVESTNVESYQGSQDYPKQSSSAIWDDMTHIGPSKFQLAAQAPARRPKTRPTQGSYERLEQSTYNNDRKILPDEVQTAPPEVFQAPTTLSEASSRPKKKKMPVTTLSTPEPPPIGFIDVEAITRARTRRAKLTEEQRSALDKKLHRKVDSYAWAANPVNIRGFFNKMVSNPKPIDFKELLDQGADVNMVKHLSEKNWYLSEAPLSLLSIVMYYKTNLYWKEIAKLFLERGAKIAEDCWQVTLKYCSNAKVSLLLSYGADVNAQFTVGEFKGRRPLEVASGSEFAKTEVIETLLRNGANINLCFPLTAAVRFLNVFNARFWLEKGADATVSGEEKTLLQLVDAVDFAEYSRSNNWLTDRRFEERKVELKKLLKRYRAVE